MSKVENSELDIIWLSQLTQILSTIIAIAATGLKHLLESRDIYKILVTDCPV